MLAICLGVNVLKIVHLCSWHDGEWFVCVHLNKHTYWQKYISI